jgi:hypothetical protein
MHGLVQLLSHLLYQLHSLYPNIDVMIKHYDSEVSVMKFLRELGKWRKTTISSVTSVRPSVCPQGIIP